MSARTRANRDAQALLKASQARVDRVTAADAAFFDRFPQRSHRIRLTAAAELEQNRIVSGETDRPLIEGRRWFTAVKQVAPGVRMRLFAQSAADADVDTMPEDEARACFEFIAKDQPQARQIEARLTAAVERRGGK